jgi:adenylate kinase family enzyme
MRVAIVGNSGSGKSTLAHQIAATHSLPSLDLDSVAWEPGTVAVPRSAEAAGGDVRAFCEQHDGWIVEGCYADLTRRALGYSPLLLFMDPGVDACLSNCRQRPWEPHKYRSKDQQDARLEFLMSWVRDYYTRSGDLSHAEHQALYDGYRGPKRRLTASVDGAFVQRLPVRWYADGVDDLGSRFETCTIAKREWTHAAHLTVGLWHVRRYGPDEALARLRTGIRRLNESHGGVNSDTDGYHETITAAYVQLLAGYLDGRPRPLSEAVVELLESPLASKHVLLTFYSRERLTSTTARAVWVEPDLAPIRANVRGGLDAAEV